MVSIAALGRICVTLVAFAHDSAMNHNFSHLDFSPSKLHQQFSRRTRNTNHIPISDNKFSNPSHSWFSWFWHGSYGRDSSGRVLDQGHDQRPQRWATPGQEHLQRPHPRFKTLARRSWEGSRSKARRTTTCGLAYIYNLRTRHTWRTRPSEHHCRYRLHRAVQTSKIWRSHRHVRTARKHHRHTWRRRRFQCTICQPLLEWERGSTACVCYIYSLTVYTLDLWKNFLDWVINT